MPRFLLAWLMLAPALCAAQEAAPRSGWRAGVEGIGPIRVGMSLDQARRATGMEFTEEPDRNSDWLACHVAWLSSGGTIQLDFSLMLERGLITRIDVASSEVATRSGVRVGDPDSSILHSYEGRLEEERAADGTRYLTIYPKQSHQLVFVSADGRITSFRVGLATAVHHEEGCA